MVILRITSLVPRAVQAMQQSASCASAALTLATAPCPPKAPTVFSLPGLFILTSGRPEGSRAKAHGGIAETCHTRGHVFGGSQAATSNHTIGSAEAFRLQGLWKLEYLC